MKQQPLSDIERCWAAYKESGDPEARERLIINYSPLVKYVAGRLSSNLPQTVDTADLISYGVFGLIDAIDKFEPDRGIKFETYAIARIKGAIIDELRALDWVPRSVRSRARDIENAYISLENRLKRVPTDAEVAAELGISLRELDDLLARLAYTSVVSFEELWSGNQDREDRGGQGATQIQDHRAEDPVEVYESKELRQILADAIDRLPERERAVITLYYYEGLTLKEIGTILGVTESRVSQLHTKAVLRLRARIRAAQGLAPTL